VLLPGGEKGKQSQSLFVHRRLVLTPNRLVERRDEKRGSRFLPDRLPARPHETVDQDRAFHDPVAAEQAEVLPRRHDPRAVGVAEKDVVVVRQQTDRDGGTRRRAG
jgi:hypothetical protein